MGSTRARCAAAVAVTSVTLFVTATTAFAGEAPDPAAAADAGERTTTTTTTTTGYHPVPAIFILGLTCVVIALCLWFVFRYHQQLLATIDKAVARGAAGPISAEDHGVGVQSREVAGGVKITGPSTVTTGAQAMFTADGLSGGETLSWTVDGDVGADPAAGGDQTFTTTFAKAGTATVALDLVGGTAPPPLTVTVTAPAVDGAKGVVLPFVVRNWGRLVVVLFGAGLVGSLMVLGVIGSEGGVALLGALLGVGAATAAPATGATPGATDGAGENG
jgi:hypothetical protein